MAQEVVGLVLHKRCKQIDSIFRSRISENRQRNCTHCEKCYKIYVQNIYLYSIIVMGLEKIVAVRL